MIIVLVIVIIIAIPLVAALFTAKAFTIEQEVNISKPLPEVFSYLSLLKNTNYWSKWVMTDPNMIKAYKGTDGTVGAIYAWDSENKQVGKGEQEITKMAEGSRIDYEVRFIKPFEGTSTAWITTDAPAGNQTRVKWFFHGNANYMMRIMHLVLNLKKVLAKDMATSLTNLKTLLEKSN